MNKFRFTLIFLTLECAHVNGTPEVESLVCDSSNCAMATDTITKDKNNAIRDSIVCFAEKFIGKPYRSAGKGPKTFDCSGFTSYIYKNFGHSLSASASGQHIETPYINIEEVEKGDLLFFKGRNAKEKRVGHVAMVYDIDKETKSIKIIHAALNGGVRYDLYPDNRYYRERFVRAGRVLSDRIELKTDSTTEAEDKNSGQDTTTIAKVIENKSDTILSKESLTICKVDSIIHTIQKGDNLYRISKKYKVKIEEIKEKNKLPNNNLRIGDTLIICIKKGED